MSENWVRKDIRTTSYLRGRIGWQGLRADEFIEEGPHLVTGTDFVDGKINWDTCYHVTEARFAEGSYIHLQDHDILITKDGTIGKIAFVSDCPEKAVLNSGIFLLRCLDGSYDQRFMYHLLCSHVFQEFLEDNLAGSTIKHLYQHVFERFEFPAPNLEEQLAISNQLDALDEIVQMSSLVIDKHQRIKTGLMQDLLSKGIDESGSIRSEETHEFRDSSLGRIPASWKTAGLRSFADKQRAHIKTGPFGSSLKGEHWVSEGVPVITIGALLEDGLDHNELFYITPDKAKQLSAYTLIGGDIVFSRVADVGRSYVITTAEEGWVMSSNLMRIALNKSIAEPDFLQLQLAHSQAVRRQIRQYVNSGGREIANGPVLNALRFTWPELAEQKRIVALAKMVRERIGVHKDSHHKLLSLKAGLMRDLLSGKVSIPIPHEQAKQAVGATA